MKLAGHQATAARILIALLAVALLLALAGSAWLWRAERPRFKASQSQPVELGESAGRILGLTIGSPMQEAREKLDPLREPVSYTPDAKEKSGRRIYWKLKGTEFDWIMAWADAGGKITRLRAVFRPERQMPFADIGDLRTAAAVSPTSAKWNLRVPQGPYYRLIAQGAGQRAQTVYMFALDSFGENAGTQEPEAEDED